MITIRKIFVVGAFFFSAICAHAQGTDFTYQGRLAVSGALAGGTYDLRFTAYDAVTAGNAVSGMVTNSTVAISNGLFSVTINFGAGVFTGANRWLEIAVRTNCSGSFTNLASRQPNSWSTPLKRDALQHFCDRFLAGYRDGF